MDIRLGTDREEIESKEAAEQSSMQSKVRIFVYKR
jgi:hypothetical protein